MLRVLFITRKWPPAVGGMELYSVELADAMRKITDIRVRALPGKQDGSPPSFPSLLLFVINTFVFLARNGRRYDVIYVGDFVLFPLLVWARCVAPSTRRGVTVHGLDLLYGARKGLRPAVFRFLIGCARTVQGCAHMLVANSRATADIARRAGFQKVAAVPLGTSLIAPLPPPLTDNEAPTGSPFILFVGRIVPRKGAAWFAHHVMPLLSEDVTLKVVGAPWDAQELAELGQAERTTYLGRIPDSELRALRRQAAVTVMPNRSLDGTDIEGFGLAALEAVAAGSLLVAAGIEGIVDAVVDGETGFLLPEGDAEAWAAKIRELLDWPPQKRFEFVAHAHEILETRYSWSRVARQTLNAVINE